MKKIRSNAIKGHRPEIEITDKEFLAGFLPLENSGMFYPGPAQLALIQENNKTHMHCVTH